MKSDGASSSEGEACAATYKNTVRVPLARRRTGRVVEAGRHFPSDSRDKKKHLEGGGGKTQCKTTAKWANQQWPQEMETIALGEMRAITFTKLQSA